LNFAPLKIGPTFEYRPTKTSLARECNVFKVGVVEDRFAIRSVNGDIEKVGELIFSDLGDAVDTKIARITVSNSRKKSSKEFWDMSGGVAEAIRKILPNRNNILAYPHSFGLY